ncbi:MAG TPA: DnaB-like helicase C-terminal domain-containing protein [Gemmatimonadaceae bacterium]|jgi:replicative DNA helicase|nr:DnaB-like helicase C-terminal domain-containing protein [Gemmatimonadaceae bacterium]
MTAPLNHYDRTGPVLSLDDERERRARAEMPDADMLVEEQLSAATARIHEDSTSYPKYPWRDLASLAGPMCPGDLILVAARTGGGKSLFLQNLFDSLIRSNLRGLYIGLEQGPEVLRVKWACMAMDVPPKVVLAAGDIRGTPVWHDAMGKVQRHIAWQRDPWVRERAHFATTRRINAAGLKRWTDWGVDLGCQFVVVDHVDRIAHGDGKNSFHEMSETVRLAKELAVQNHIVMLVASQMGRPADAAEQFMPPSLHALRGGGTKEEESDTVLGVYRPLKPSVSDKQLKLVRQGLALRDTVVEPNTMAVMVLKHRLEGPVAGQVAKLFVRHQRVQEMREADRYSTQSRDVGRQF